MTELAKIDKPDIEKFKDKKKIYFVRNLYPPENATAKYKEIFNRYWDEVEQHLSKLEAAGKVSKIFCESIYMTGDDSMKVLKNMNTRLEQIVKKKIEAGGSFLPLEDKEIFGAYIDWNNCLIIVRTPTAYKTIYKQLQEVTEARFKHIRSVLEEQLGERESALLIMGDENRESLDLPDDMEIFFITPPAYDDLMHFVSKRDNGKEYWRTV